MEVGSPIATDSEIIILYFIEGIPESKTNKSILYQASSIKGKIRLYNRVNVSAPQSNYKVFGLARKDTKYH